MKKTARLLWSLCLALVLQACGSGGGGGTAALTGQFVDDPVEGLTYQCAGGSAASISGLTNAQGQFNYQTGHTCTFSVGKVTVGSLTSIPADGLVTPQDVAGVARTATTSPSATAIAQFLQSLSEPGSNGKIKISEATTAALASVPEIKLVDTAGPIAQDTLRTLVTTLGKTLVTPAQAAANLDTGITNSKVSKSGGVVTASTPKSINSISVSAPSESQSAVAAGGTIKLTAMANWSDGTGSGVDGTVTWSSSDTTVATVASDGMVTSLKPGTVKISATNSKFTGRLELTVTEAVLQSMSVPSGLTDNLPLGVSRALSLLGTYSDGSQKTLSNGVSWSVDNSSKASVEQGALVAKATGDVNVTGTIGTVSQTFKLTVSPAVLRSLAISRVDLAETSAAVAAGRTVQLKAMGTYSDSSTQDLSSAITWSASNNKLAVATGGLVTTIQAGNSTVTVTDSQTQISATANLTVGAAELASLSITAPSNSLALGLNQTLTLKGTYTDGSENTSLTGVQWTSSDPGKLSVAGNGLVTSLAQGSVKVTASVGGVSRDVTVNVTEPVAKALTVSSVLNSIANGASAVFDAVATLTNDAKVSVAKLVNWTIESLGGQAVYAIDGDTVRVTGTAAGDVRVKGEYQGVFGSFQLTVRPPVISGVVAVGAPLPSVSVIVTDANGVELAAETAADGTYQLYEPAGVQLVAPFKVKVKSLLGNTEVSLNSFALQRGATTNVTPLSTAVMALINASNGYNASALDVASITPAKLADANTKLATALAPVMAAANVSANDFNPVFGAFVANNQGIDSVMDRISVDPLSTGISISNRFALLTEGQASPAPIVVSTTGTSGTLPVGISPPSADTLARFVANLKKCFRVEPSERVKFTVNAAGRSIFTPGSLHPDCNAVVDSEYRSQGQTFGQRWLYFLSSADFNSSTQFVLVPQYVVDRSNATPAWPGDQKAYVYNINLVDKNKLTYTMPEVMAKVNDNFFIRGNQRRFDISIQPMFSKLSDNAGNANSIEGRIRVGIDPTLVPVNGVGTYQYTADGTKPLPKILCAWVTGPLLQKNEQHDPNNPLGGVLMVPPHSDLTARRDYSAVRIKYPMDFDPKNNATHRAALFNDCKRNHTASTVEIASAETNSAFTIDAVKTNAASTTTFAAYTPLNAPVAYPTSLTRTACPVFNSSGTQTNTAQTGNTATTAATVSGWCNSTRRESMVTPALRAAFEDLYKDPKDLQYTFYVFVDSNYSETTANTAYGSYANADTFFDSAEKVNVRLVGKLPFLDKTTTNGVEVYAGAEQFRGVGQSMIDNYLKAGVAGAATLLKNSTISGSWTIPAGAEGIDRLGIGGWFRKSDGSRIGAATFADSFGLPRTLNSANFTLTEDWYGFDRQTYKNGAFVATPFSATSAYREIWVRSYDRYNRQIQTVEFAVR